MLGSKMSPHQHSHPRHHQQHQQQDAATLEHSRPSIADMLSGRSISTSVDDSDQSCRRHQPPAIRSQCSDATNIHIDSKTTDRPITNQCRPISDRSKFSDASNCSISTSGDHSVYSSVSSTRRVQKPPIVTSLHGRTVSQIFSPQTDFGSMMSGLNYSLPQLNNIDNINSFASHNGLNRTGDGGCDKRFSCNVENVEVTELRREHTICCSNDLYRSDSNIRPPQSTSVSVLGNSVMKSGVEDLIGRQLGGVEHGLKTREEMVSGSVTSRRDEEERRMAEFTAIEESLRTSLSTIDKHLEKIQTTCSNLSSASDVETIENFSSQFAHSEQQLVQLTSVSGDVLEVAENVEIVKAIQEKVMEMTRQVASTRKMLGDTRALVQSKYDEHQCGKLEMNQLMDWLSDASQRLSECTEHPSVNTVTAEQQLGQLLTLVHEFNAHKSRFHELSGCAGLDGSGIVELVHQFDQTNDACRVAVERHRCLFTAVTDIRNSVQQIAGWVVKTGPIYSLDSGSAAGSLDMLEDNHTELENRLEEATQLKKKAVEFLASLRPAEDQKVKGKGRMEDELSLMQPLLEVQCQLYQLRELIATRAANMVRASSSSSSSSSSSLSSETYHSAWWVFGRLQ